MAKEITRDSTYEEIKLAKALAKKIVNFILPIIVAGVLSKKNYLVNKQLSY